MTKNLGVKETAASLGTIKMNMIHLENKTGINRQKNNTIILIVVIPTAIKKMILIETKLTSNV